MKPFRALAPGKVLVDPFTTSSRPLGPPATGNVCFDLRSHMPALLPLEHSWMTNGHLLDYSVWSLTTPCHHILTAQPITRNKPPHT